MNLLRQCLLCGDFKPKSLFGKTKQGDPKNICQACEQKKEELAENQEAERKYRARIDHLKANRVDRSLKRWRKTRQKR